MMTTSEVLISAAIVAAGAAGGWVIITRPHSGLRIWGGEKTNGDELSMPCKHPLRKLDVVFEQGENPRESGNVAVLLVCRCTSCGEDRLGDFAILSESDGRIVIENTTPDEYAIVIDGELHNLEPHGRRNPAAHIVRLPRGGARTVTENTPIRLRDYIIDDDEMIGDRDLDEGDKT